MSQVLYPGTACIHNGHVKYSKEILRHHTLWNNFFVVDMLLFEYLNHNPITKVI